MILLIHPGKAQQFVFNHRDIIQPLTAASASNKYFTTSSDEFVSLLKLKFGDLIKTYSEICNDPELAFHYAEQVVNGPFVDGETAIASSTNFAYFYANEILKSRFLLGEAAISNSNYVRNRYNTIFDTQL